MSESKGRVASRSSSAKEDCSGGGTVGIDQIIVPISSTLAVAKPVVLMVGYPPKVLTIDQYDIVLAVPPPTAMTDAPRWILTKNGGSDDKPTFAIQKPTPAGTPLKFLFANPAAVANDQLMIEVAANPGSASKWSFMKHETNGIFFLGICSHDTSGHCDTGMCIMGPPPTVSGGTLFFADFSADFNARLNWYMMNLP